MREGPTTPTRAPDVATPEEDVAAQTHEPVTAASPDVSGEQALADAVALRTRLVAEHEKSMERLEQRRAEIAAAAAREAPSTPLVQDPIAPAEPLRPEPTRAPSAEEIEQVRGGLVRNGAMSLGVGVLMGVPAVVVGAPAFMTAGAVLGLVGGAFLAGSAFAEVWIQGGSLISGWIKKGIQNFFALFGGKKGGHAAHGGGHGGGGHH